MTTPARLKELSVGYGMDGGGYEFEDAPEPLGGAVVVWGDPDLDYLGLQDEDRDCPVDLFAFAPNSGHFPRHEFPKSFKEGDQRYVRVNQGDLPESQPECNCNGHLAVFTGAAGEPQKPLSGGQVAKFLKAGALIEDDVEDGDELVWEFSDKTADTPYPDCDRCDGDGFVTSSGGEWAFYRLLWDDEG